MKFETIGNISEDLIVTNTADWLRHQGLDPEATEYEDNPVIELVGQMIALDAAIFILRRTAYLCGSNIDYLRDIHNKLQRRYKVLTLEDWDDRDFNKDIDW